MLFYIQKSLFSCCSLVLFSIVVSLTGCGGDGGSQYTAEEYSKLSTEGNADSTRTNVEAVRGMIKEKSDISEYVSETQPMFDSWAEETSDPNSEKYSKLKTLWSNLASANDSERGKILDEIEAIANELSPAKASE